MKSYSVPELVEASIKLGEAKLSEHGALVCKTGKFTGRAAKDKYIVRDENSENLVDWGPVNQAISPESFRKLKEKVLSKLNSINSFEQDLSVCAIEDFSYQVKVKTEYAIHALFAKTMFREPNATKIYKEKPITILCAPSVVANPKEHGTRSETFIAINFTEREIIIGGTAYAGEIKKSIFTAMNYFLPQKDILTMHAAANLGADGKSAIFFGLSGTGKTSLSTDSKRKIIGDDEHGWCDDGIFNIEGGCYAKAIRLSQKSEPEIWNACRSFATVIENVIMDENSRVLDFNSSAITENTRAAYKLSKLENYEPSGTGGHPAAVIMLTCDAFGIFPPVAKLNFSQAMYYFLSGYTAKVAGTEAGVVEPVSTFSPCFGEPFMVLPAIKYASLLSTRLKKHNVPCYLVNTGWWKGPYGVGERMPIALTRKIIDSALSGTIELAPTKKHIFGFEYPINIAGISTDSLDIRETWKNVKEFDLQATRLAKMFKDNFQARFAEKVDVDIVKAGPSV